MPPHPRVTRIPRLSYATILAAIAGAIVALVPSSARAESVRLTASLDRTTYYLGERVPIHVEVQNTGTQDMPYCVVGDLGYKLTAVDEHGQPAPTPPGLMAYSVLSHTVRLKPGEKREESLTFNGYFRISTPGRYTVTVAPDPGWEKGWWDYPPPVTLTVTLLMPDAAQAEKIVADRQQDRAPDFSSLRVDAYAPILKRLALAGDRRALEGLQDIETVAGTEALLDIVGALPANIVQQTAYSLLNRIPLGVGQHPAGPYDISARAWDPGLASKARQLALDWLKSGSPRVAGVAGMLLARVGTDEDVPLILDMLDRALEPLVTPRDAANEDTTPPQIGLAGVLVALEHRGCHVFSGTPSRPGLVLAYFSQFRATPAPRPPEWKPLLEQYVHSPNVMIRGAAIASIPNPVPPDCAQWVQEARNDADAGVRATALFVAERTVVIRPSFSGWKNAPFIPPTVIKIGGDGTVMSTPSSVDAYNEIIAHEPQDAQSYSNRASAKLDEGDLHGAIADCDQALALKPNSASALLNRGLARSRLNDLDGALADYDQAILNDPKFTLAFADRALVKLEKGDLNGATADCDRATELDLTMALPFRVRSAIELRQSRPADAARDANHALSLGDKDPAAYQVRALARDLTGDFSGAAADYRQCLSIDAKPPLYLRLRLALALRRQNEDDAAAKLDDAVAALPDGWTKRVGEFVLGKIDEQALLAAAEHFPNAQAQHMCEACYYVGMERLLHGQKSEARELFQKCVATNSASDDEFRLAQAELARL